MAEDWYVMEEPASMLFYAQSVIVCDECLATTDEGYELRRRGRSTTRLCEVCVMPYVSALSPREES